MEKINVVMLKNIVIYLIVINLITFLAMLIDKKKAEYGKWRIQESTLLILALIGGSIGEIIGMYTLHHKTRKMRFFVGVPTIIVLQILIVIAIYTL